ncbi:MAG: aminoacyl-tRNA hydrolase [Geminicoccaceae bacterium]|nr:aminoacyl-tRNA hydrolase [Geminicoccaceae bacterium]
MRLLVGLGNPGVKYARHRHNVGFMALDAIKARHRLPPFRQKYRGEFVEGLLGGERVLLLKPLTFMNESGRAVAEAARFHKIPLEDVLVFHDELDLAPGKVRVKRGGGVAGHNGLRSIDACLGSRDFGRVRLGIGHPGHKDRVTPHVLGDFAKADRDWLDPLLDAVAEAAPRLVQGDEAGFMNLVALRTAPPKPERPKRGEMPAASD